MPPSTPNQTAVPGQRPPRWLDGLTEALLYLMVLFAPWAFGTTQPWSIWSMNAGGFALGALWLAKWFLRRSQANSRAGRRLTRILQVLTVAILGYVALSGFNAEFTYVGKEWRQEPHAHVNWLPHSLDRDATWGVFWNWLALACVFWATHDWLLGEVSADGRPRAHRLRRLVFVVAGNAALVALQGVLQRSSGTAKLLWFMPTRDNPFAAAQFGPFAYRSNAAQFFNLVWPLALGVWWRTQSTLSRRASAHHWLLPAAMLLVVGSLVALSRAGAGVTVLQLCLCGGVFLVAGRFAGSSRWGLALVLVATLAAASYLGWDTLSQRFRDSAHDPLAGRRETYQLAARMAEDYPWFGVGPGAFGSVFQFYRNSPTDYWPGQLHNDWLEYRITFGRIGCALLLAAMAVVCARWFAPGGLRAHWTLASCAWIALAGCLVHAAVDFPLQIYSIQFVFVLWCAVLFAFSRERRTVAA